MLENVSEDEIDEISEELGCTPPEIQEAAKEASFDLLPAKSRKLYGASFISTPCTKHHQHCGLSTNFLIDCFTIFGNRIGFLNF